MKFSDLSLLCCILISSFAFSSSAAAADTSPNQPVAPVRPVTDDYFGTKLVDPYRWMEDLKSPEVQAWMKAQAAYTSHFIDALPGHDALVKRVVALDNAATRVGDVQLYGTHYFYFKTAPADQTPKLYTRDGLNGPEKLLADPQVLGGPGKRYTITAYYPSPDGSLVGVEVAAGGSEEGVVRIMDVATGHLHPDAIDRVWGASLSWDQSNTFFYYTRLQKLGPSDSALKKELDEAAYLHHLGDDPEKDVMVLGRKMDPNLGMVETDSAYCGTTPDSPYLLGVIAHGVKNEQTLLVTTAAAAATGKPDWKKFVDVQDDVTGAAVKGHDIWLLSHKNASRFKVLHLSLDHPDMSTADVAVAPSDLVLKNLGAAKDAIYIDAGRGGISHLLRLPDGEKHTSEVPLPYAGSTEGIFTDVRHDGVLVRLAGWTEAPQWYAYQPSDNQVTNTHLEPLNPTNFSDITSVEVTAPAPDGTPVPLSIIYKKGLAMNGQNPCLLEGYGSYGISLDPNFDATRLALLEKGIVIAYAHVRGGGENGEDWHMAGQKLTKQNTIGDFIASAEYLIKHGYTSADKLAGRGTSAGGITIGGALTQRPDLFTLCICNVGVMDALRSETGPNGAVNTPEFGSVTDPDGFKALSAMDAYQHVKKGAKYPAVLLITGANDPRVDPWELLKMTARLQASTSSKNPILLRIDYDAGHGMGSSKHQRDLITADQATLLLSRAGKG